MLCIIYLVDKLMFYKREISEALLGCLRITRRELGGWETIVLRDEMLSSLFGAKKAA